MQEDIIFAEPLGHRVVSVSAMDDHILHLIFTNGEQRVFDVKPLLRIKAFKPLQNRQLFESVKVEYGSVFWPQGIDYCPDTLYAESIALQKFIKPETVKNFL